MSILTSFSNPIAPNSRSAHFLRRPNAAGLFGERRVLFRKFDAALAKLGHTLPFGRFHPKWPFVGPCQPLMIHIPAIDFYYLTDDIYIRPRRFLRSFYCAELWYEEGKFIRIFILRTFILLRNIFPMPLRSHNLAFAPRQQPTLQ
jgi:hypothetical protein